LDADIEEALLRRSARFDPLHRFSTQQISKHSLVWTAGGTSGYAVAQNEYE